MPTEKQPVELLTIGHVAVTLGRIPRAILRAANDLGIAPHTIINGVPHFTADATEQIAQHFRDNPPPPYKSRCGQHQRRRLEP